MRRIHQVQDKLMSYRNMYEELREMQKVASTGEYYRLESEMGVIKKIITELSLIAFDRDIMKEVEK